jgi:hypothetical protein
MTVLAPYGKQWTALNKLPTLEHELFFSFLLISPSYQKIHRIHTGKAREEITAELKKVDDLYKKIGNVYGISFDDWWKNGAAVHFYGDIVPDVLTVNLDTKKPRKDLLAEIENLLDSLEKSKNKKTSQIKFLSNKIRIETLNERYWLIAYKAYQMFYNKKIENWRVGAFLSTFGNVEAKWAKELEGVDKPTAKNLDARERVGQLVSKMIKEALYLSENAARGSFPNMSPVQGVSFDYQRTYQAVLKHQFKYFSMRDQAVSQKKLPLTEKKWVKLEKAKRAKSD